MRQDAIRASLHEAASTKSFKEAALEFLDTDKIANLKNDKHRKQWRSTLETYAFPTLGDVPLRKIDTALVLRAILPVWQRTPETASRVRSRIERVIDWAKPLGYFDGENPAQLRLLKDHLGKRERGHHSAMPVAELPAFMAKLRERESLSAKALEFAILTASRTGEVIGMKWSEVDTKVWTIPADRMKAGKEHRVPLSARAIAILESNSAQW